MFSSDITVSGVISFGLSSATPDVVVAISSMCFVAAPSIITLGPLKLQNRFMHTSLLAARRIACVAFANRGSTVADQGGGVMSFGWGM